MISPLAHIEPGAKIGENVTIHPFAYIDNNVEIGDNCEIRSFVSIMSGARLGKGVKVYQGAVISASPQDFRYKGEQTFCYLGDECTIREQVIINRGITPEGGTYIGKKCFIMAASHVGHDSKIADKSILGNGVQIAGDCKVGTCTILSSGVLLHENCEIGDWVMIKGGCRISKNVPPYVIIAHNPAAYYGINAYIMRHENFPESTIDDIAKAYRHLYQCNTTLYNAIVRIEADVVSSPERENILNFLRNSKRSIVAVMSE